LGSQVRDLFQRAGFGEQVSGAGHEAELRRAAKPLSRTIVELDDGLVAVAHD
jgi:hypothetical protein